MWTGSRWVTNRLIWMSSRLRVGRIRKRIGVEEGMGLGRLVKGRKKGKGVSMTVILLGIMLIIY